LDFQKTENSLVPLEVQHQTHLLIQEGSSKDIGVVGASTAMKGMFSDATLTILSNKNNPIVEVRYADIFPTSLSALDFNQNATDVEYLQATATFKYKLYEIITL